MEGEITFPLHTFFGGFMTEIIVKRNEPQLGDYVLSVQERENIKRKIDGIDAQLRTANDPHIKHNISDEHVAYLTGSRLKIIASLEKKSPQSLKPVEMNKLKKREDELAQEFKETLIPDDLMKLGPKRTRGIVEKQIRWKKEFEETGKTQEYKRIARTLNPDDPEAGNIERLRPEH